MLKYDDEDKSQITVQQIIAEVFNKIDSDLTEKYKISRKDWASAFKVTGKTIFTWRNKGYLGGVLEVRHQNTNYNKIQLGRGDGMEGVEQIEDKNK